MTQIGVSNIPGISYRLLGYHIISYYPKEHFERGKVCNVLTTLEYPASPMWSLGIHEPRSAQLQLSLTHFLLIHVNDLGRSRPWSQRSQGWVLSSFLEQGCSTLTLEWSEERNLILVKCKLSSEMRWNGICEVMGILHGYTFSTCWIILVFS